MHNPSASGSASSEEAEQPKQANFIAVMLVIMNEAISVSMLFPYVGLLVVHADTQLQPADAGMLSGLIVGCFQLAQAVFGPTWGTQSDRWGRKPMMALGLVASTTFAICFGMADNIWQLLLFRFLYGTANGTAPLCKTMIAELATKKTAPKAWSLMSTGRSIGSTIGPMVGGLLYDPARQLWPSVFAGTVFDTHPGLLPALAGALYSAFALIVVFTMLPETNKNARQPKWLSQLMTCSWPSKVGTVESDSPTPRDGNDASSTTLENAAPYGLADMLRCPRLSRVMASYVVVSIVNASFTELLPLLAILPIAQGGLGLTARPIGIIFMLIAAEAVTTNMLFPLALRRTSRSALLRWGLFAWGASIAFTPILTYAPWVSHVGWTVFSAALYLSVRTAASSWCLSVTTMSIADLAPKKHLGVATALSHSCGNLARALFPPFCTMLFAWSVGSNATPVTTGVDVGSTLNATAHTWTTSDVNASVHPFPFNKWLTFLLLGFGIAASAMITAEMKDADFTAPPPPDVSSPPAAVVVSMTTTSNGDGPSSIVTLSPLTPPSSAARNDDDDDDKDKDKVHEEAAPPLHASFSSPSPLSPTPTTTPPSIPAAAVVVVDQTCVRDVSP